MLLLELPPLLSLPASLLGGARPNVGLLRGDKDLSEVDEREFVKRSAPVGKLHPSVKGPPPRAAGPLDLLLLLELDGA